MADMTLPASLQGDRDGDVAILKLARPQKRNALDDETILGIETFFTSLPDASERCCCMAKASIFPQASTSASCRSATSSRASRTQGFGTAPSKKSNSARCQSSPCCMAPWSRRAGARGRRACPCRRTQRYYALAGRQPRHLCRRRRLGAAAALDRRRAMMDMMLTGRTYSARKARPWG